MTTEMKVIEALRLNNWTDIQAVPEIQEDMPFNDNGGDPDGNAWLLTDYTPAQREILISNGADVVNVQVVLYERQHDDMVLVIDGKTIPAEDFPGEWMGMSAANLAYLVIDEVLNAVMTAAEAAEVYGLAEVTVRQAINRRMIIARKSAGTWLIKRADAEQRWGNHVRKTVEK